MNEENIEVVEDVVECRPLTGVEAIELQDHLVGSLQGIDVGSKSVEELTEMLGTEVKAWLDGRKLVRNDPTRVIVNPCDEVWVDVGHLLCVHEASTEPVDEE